MTHPVPRPLSRVEALSLAAALTVLAIAVPWSFQVLFLYEAHFESVPWLTYGRFTDLCLILLGLMLTLPAPRESGLRIGDIRRHWKGVLLLTAGPLLLCAVVYPLLPERHRPFRGSDVSLWLTSPLAQDLIFGGVIYRLIRPHFSTYIHPRLPMEWALPVGGLFFAGWHLQNFGHFPAEYVWFQLLYTWAAFTFVGLTRQWTGSILYVTLAHMAGNFVAWYVD